MEYQLTPFPIQWTKKIKNIHIYIHHVTISNSVVCHQLHSPSPFKLVKYVLKTLFNTKSHSFYAKFY